ncbi:MAG: thiamine pyrophosphate-binding protein, partial [Pseudomonadota bacterium]
MQQTNVPPASTDTTVRGASDDRAAVRGASSDRTAGRGASSDRAAVRGASDDRAAVRGADVIAQKLAAAGCTHAFGIPGGEVLTIIDALAQAGIAFHLTKHENFAGFLAEGVWHATGAPGILVATIGPGVANAVNVIANAEQDRVPLVVITGCMDGADADTYTHQLFDHQAVLSPITKASYRLNAGSIDAVMDKALTVMASGQPGPVHLDLPIKVAEAAAAPASPLPARSGPSVPAE